MGESLRWGQTTLGEGADPDDVFDGSDRSVRSETAAVRHTRWTSRRFHELGTVASHSWAGWVVLATALVWVAVGVATGFPAYWVITLESTTSIVTIVMLFVIQHLHQRDQTVIHRKLDELLRSDPRSSNQLISLERAPDEHLEALTKLNFDERVDDASGEVGGSWR